LIQVNPILKKSFFFKYLCNFFSLVGKSGKTFILLSVQKVWTHQEVCSKKKIFFKVRSLSISVCSRFTVLLINKLSFAQPCRKQSRKQELLPLRRQVLLLRLRLRVRKPPSGGAENVDERSLPPCPVLHLVLALSRQPGAR